VIRALVLDVDGVLVKAGVFGEVLDERYGLSRDATASFFQGPFVQCVLGRADLRAEIAPFVREWSFEGAVDDLLRLWFEADSEVDAAVLDVVERVREEGVPCYVASTQERYRASYLASEIGLASRFDGLFFSCHVGSKKPEAAFFDHVVREIDVRPDELLFFDDHPPNVHGARERGWNAEEHRFGDDIEPVLMRYLRE